MHRALHVLGGRGGTCEHALRTDLFINSWHYNLFLFCFLVNARKYS